jgi:hypothetical protein
MKINAKQELLDSVKGLDIKCAYVYRIAGASYFDSDLKTKYHYLLKLNYSTEDFRVFIESLDFDYDNGYGGQELFGLVWLIDNTWLERGEYDGSEWWDYKTTPRIPDCLL